MAKIVMVLVMVLYLYGGYALITKSWLVNAGTGTLLIVITLYYLAFLIIQPIAKTVFSKKDESEKPKKDSKE